VIDRSEKETFSSEQVDPREVDSNPPVQIHFDNASPHRSSETTNFLEAHHVDILSAPPYSPDISPSDFFLFGYLKRELKGKVFQSERSLKDAIDSLLKEIPAEMLRITFDNWYRRCAKVEKDGEYYSET
jgi:transposase